MKKAAISLTILLLALSVILTVVGANAKPFQVAVILPSTIHDFSWCQSMYNALDSIRAEMGEDNFEFVYSENMYIVADAADAIRDYAAEGYDLVIAHGSQYGSSLTEIAPDFPDTAFAWGSTANIFRNQGITNVFAYEPQAQEAGYVNGVLAAKLSKSGIFGVVGPVETGSNKSYADGFEAGVLETRPDAEIHVTWINSFVDLALASEAAHAHIDAGADVLAGGAQMFVGAIAVAEERGVLCFGYEWDQTEVAPDVVVCSAVDDFTVALKPMIQLVKDGKEGEILPLSLANGGFYFVVNQQALVGRTINDILEGKIAFIESYTLEE